MTVKIRTYPDLAGKVVVVVTGSSRGTGAATCRMLAANGAKRVVNGRGEAAVHEIVANIRSDGGDTTGFAADATDLDALERLKPSARARPRTCSAHSWRAAGHSPGRPSRSPRRTGTEPSWATSTSRS